MKSQKQRNRPPRPFKNKGSDQGWSGGGFIPVSHKQPVRLPQIKAIKPASAVAPGVQEQPPEADQA